MPKMQHAGYVSGLHEALYGAIFSHHTPGRKHCSSRGLWHRISDLVYRGQPLHLHITTELAKTDMSAGHCVSALLNKIPEASSLPISVHLLTEPFREIVPVAFAGFTQKDCNDDR